MPLPAYMTQQVNPIEALTNQIARLGVLVDIVREGRTVTMRSFDADEGQASGEEAIRLFTRFADSHLLSAKARIHSVSESYIRTFEQAGFQIHEERDPDDETSYTLMHRTVRQ